MNIFDFKSYKKYVVERVKAMPRQGHGEFSKIAKHLGVNPVIVTQVLKGSRDFSEEQGLRLTEYLGLTSMEAEFFMRLLAMERAGTHQLKEFHREAAETLKKKTQQLESKLGEYHELDDVAKSVFYSDWKYSAIRMLTIMPQFQTVDALADRLRLDRKRVADFVNFLLQWGLCVRNEAGKIERGPANTHLESKSRFTNSSRRNWRLKGLEAIGRGVMDDEFFYSSTCTVSTKDFNSICDDMVEVVASYNRKVQGSKAEELACLNIDWFRL